MPVNCTCKQCGKIFPLKPCAVKRGRGKFCSRACQGKYKFSGEKNPKYRAALKTVRCLQCGEEFQTYLSQIKNGGGKYCSYSCKFKHQNIGRQNGNWKGGSFSVGGYVAVSVGKSNRKYEHQEVAARALNRPLRADEVVHHINGNKQDNRNVNLLICSRGYHHSLHQRMARFYQLEKFSNI